LDERRKMTSAEEPAREPQRGPLWILVSRARGTGLLALVCALCCVGACSRNPVDAETPEEAARIWAQLICESRASGVDAELEAIERRRDLLKKRARLVPTDEAASEGVIDYEVLATFVAENQDDLEACKISVQDKSERGEKKFWLDVSVAFQRVAVSETPKLEEVVLRLGVETTLIDEVWRITAESPNLPRHDDLRVFDQEADRPFYF